MYTTTLLAGERSGNLPEVLDRYVSFQKVALTLRKKLIGSLIYPARAARPWSARCSSFMFTVVVPQFALLYDQIGNKLPAMTLALLSFGKWMQHNILWLVLIAAPSAVAALPLLPHRARQGLYRRRARRASHLRQNLAQVPGGAFRAHALHAAHRRLAAGSLAGNRRPLHLVAPRVPRPSRLPSAPCAKAKASPSRSTETGVFPDLATEMITVGEQTGALPQMLNSVAEFFEEDVATALAAALALIEPAILIVMGVVVVFILISLYLPIFSLGQASGM